MYRSFVTTVACLLLCMSGMAGAADSLLYFEAQGITGYSSESRKPIYNSMNTDAEMQKSSIGFDYLKRFSGESGDVATFALQVRLAAMVDEEERAGSMEAGPMGGGVAKDRSTVLEPQIYNAYVKAKVPGVYGPYVWVGHNRPAFGLSSYFDSHGLILRTLAIQGFGYDRDWGVGLYKDFSWGDVSASATTGSGMPVYVNKGSYMTTARASYGVLSQDNMNVGLSFGYGETLDTMGYKLRDAEPEPVPGPIFCGAFRCLFTPKPEPKRMELAALDATFLRNNFEHRFDFFTGKWLGKYMYALFYRFGMNLDPESRLKIEAQPTYWRFGDERNYQLSLCISAVATSNLTVRLAHTYDHVSNDKRTVLQLYYYRPILQQ